MRHLLDIWSDLRYNKRMFPTNTHTLRASLKWATVSLGTLSITLVTYGLMQHESSVQLVGRLLPAHTQGRLQWVTISPAQIMSGTTIPANINVIVHIPEEITSITRKTLFARKGDTVRYWGYCFPHNLAESAQNTTRGFPGDLFLSEAERAYRKGILETQRRRTFSVFKNLTEEDLNQSAAGPRSLIRHQVEVFRGGTSCYVMTETSIPVGIDRDDDGFNSAMERAYGSSDSNPDSDGDGVPDGLEVFRAGTHPTKRDSDGDGLIDGIEDQNHNGIVDIDETNPAKWDTDNDGLCDGLCKVNKGQDLRGEDKNLNGIYEPNLNEYNPRSRDSDGDGVLDEHEVYLCVIGGGSDC